MERAAHGLAVNVANSKTILATVLLGPPNANDKRYSWFGTGVIKRHFMEGSYISKWPALKESTLERRKRYLKKHPALVRVPGAGSNRPLLETGLLYDSLTYLSRKVQGGMKMRVYVDPRRYGKDKRHRYIYANIHNEGIGVRQRRFLCSDRPNGNWEERATIEALNKNIFENKTYALPGGWI